MGGLNVRRRQRRPGHAWWKDDKNNYQFRDRHGLFDCTDNTVLRAGWGKDFLNPTGQGFNNGFDARVRNADRVE